MFDYLDLCIKITWLDYKFVHDPMGKPGRNPDGTARLKYLQKAAESVSSSLPCLAAKYADCMKQISKKTQVSFIIFVDIYLLKVSIRLIIIVIQMNYRLRPYINGAIKCSCIKILTQKYIFFRAISVLKV